MARVCPVTMIFIPCHKGYSHRPDEYASSAAITMPGSAHAGCDPGRAGIRMNRRATDGPRTHARSPHPPRARRSRWPSAPGLPEPPDTGTAAGRPDFGILVVSCLLAGEWARSPTLGLILPGNILGLFILLACCWERARCPCVGSSPRRACCCGCCRCCSCRSSSLRCATGPSGPCKAARCVRRGRPRTGPFVGLVTGHLAQWLLEKVRRPANKAGTPDRGSHP